MILDGRVRSLIVISICSIGVVSCRDSTSKALQKVVKFRSRIIELKRFDVPTSDDYGEGIFADVFPQLQNVNAFIFEYQHGKRIIGDELLLWDTKSWKFPKQDVSLRIKYPENHPSNSTTYYLTHFRAYISQDAKDSHGYLISGGSGQSNLDLKFVTSSARYLSYDIRVFGIHSDLIRNHTEVFGNENIGMNN
ncbi:uncharacterized protein LOC143916688 [Arctopsyche grandis]|uniref:uncharacterized protein LOC143916688 n=1 Tax=Arctopsyche grandis TaxID=121162 RepID=UPI00406D8777